MKAPDEWTLGDGIYSCKFCACLTYYLLSSAQPRFLCPLSKLAMQNLGENFEQVQFDNSIISGVRSVVERVIRCIKCWKFMYTPFRGKNWRNHEIGAHAVMNLVQWQFEIRGHPSFDESLAEFLWAESGSDSS